MVYEIQTTIRLMIETWMIVLWMIVSYPNFPRVSDKAGFYSQKGIFLKMLLTSKMQSKIQLMEEV